MKEMKKLSIFLGLFVFCAGLLLAGGGQSTKGGAKTLELWHCQTSEPLPAIIQGSADRFIKDNPDYKVSISNLDSDSYEQKLAIAMNSGKLPDVFISWSGGKMMSYVDSGLLTDLTPYMNANNYKNKFLDAGIAQASYNGKIYGVPVEGVSVCAVFYDKDIFNKYKLAVPTTLKELEAVCDTLVRNKVIPFALANKSKWTGSMYFMYLATRYGGLQPFENAVSGKGSFTDPAFVYAGKKIQEWVNKKYFNDGYNSLDTQIGQDRQLLYNGDAAMHLMGSWFIYGMYSENPAFANKMGVFMWPRDEAGVNNADAVVGTVGDNFYHISSASPNKDKAFELISHLLDDQAIKERLDASKTIPMKNMVYTEPFSKELMVKIQEAKGVQLWYDQSLSPEASEVHKDTCQEIFGLTMTPETAAQRLQEAQARFLRGRK